MSRQSSLLPEQNKESWWPSSTYAGWAGPWWDFSWAFPPIVFLTCLSALAEFGAGALGHGHSPVH